MSEVPRTITDYRSLKQQMPAGDLLGIRTGSFIEFFDDDALIVSTALGIVKAERRFGNEVTSMCCIPAGWQGEQRLAKLSTEGFEVHCVGVSTESDGDEARPLSREECMQLEQSIREGRSTWVDICPVVQPTARPLERDCAATGKSRNSVAELATTPTEVAAVICELEAALSNYTAACSDEEINLADRRLSVADDNFERALSLAMSTDDSDGRDVALLARTYVRRWRGTDVEDECGFEIIEQLASRVAILSEDLRKSQLNVIAAT